MGITMSDSTKSCLSIFFFAAMFILPIVGFVVGWTQWDVRTGLIIAAVIFVLCFVAAGALIATVKQIPWLVVALPIVGALVYLVLPDIVPGPVDDGVVMTAGTLVSILLALKKQFASGNATEIAKSEETNGETL